MHGKHDMHDMHDVQDKKLQSEKRVELSRYHHFNAFFEIERRGIASGTLGLNKAASKWIFMIFVDVMIVVGCPKSQSYEKSLRDWSDFGLCSCRPVQHNLPQNSSKMRRVFGLRGITEIVTFPGVAEFQIF